MKRNVINDKNIPQKFQMSFWIAVWLILDRFNLNETIMISFWIIIGLWILIFGWIKSNEISFDAFKIYSQIEKWIK